MKKCRISVHPLTLPALGFVLACCPVSVISLFSGRGLAFFSAVLLHESAHLLLMKRFGVPVREVRVSPFGIVMKGDFSRCPYGAEALIHGAGGCMNLLCALILALCGRPDAANIHILLGLYNLMPLRGFDGGRMLLSLLLLLPCGERYACRVSGIVTQLCFAALYILSGGVFWMGMHAGNGSYLSGALFFAVSAVWAADMLSSGCFSDTGSGKEIEFFQKNNGTVPQ